MSAAAVAGMYSATGRAPEVHTGQHLQGCVTCHAVVGAEARGLRVPELGDRVVVAAMILGEAYAVEIAVEKVDLDPATRKLRVTGRPEGAVIFTLSSTEWREVAP